ncbi:hypothetical protein ACJX0J_031327, partial [Zea mays]
MLLAWSPAHHDLPHWDLLTPFPIFFFKIKDEIGRLPRTYLSSAASNSTYFTAV